MPQTIFEDETAAARDREWQAFGEADLSPTFAPAPALTLTEVLEILFLRAVLRLGIGRRVAQDKGSQNG